MFTCNKQANERHPNVRYIRISRKNAQASAAHSLEKFLCFTCILDTQKFPAATKSRNVRFIPNIIL